MNNLQKIGKGIQLQYRRAKSRGFRSETWDKTRILYPFRLFLHPLDTFNDIKYEGKASLLIANVIMFLYFIIRVLETTSTGYLFSTTTPDKVNILLVFAETVGVALLWAICNWASCTLFDGEGKMKEIWIVTAYAFIPSVLIEPIGLLLSYVLSQDEAILFGTIQTIAMGWSLLLLFLGIMTVQQFTVTKTILLSIVTVFLILALCFLFLMFFSISQQMVGFVTNIVTELTYR